MKPSVVVRNLSKTYPLYNENRPYTLQEAALSGWRHVRAKSRFWVLKDIDFTLFPGQMLGVIGKNGAGKSTLLKTIAGILKPDEGYATISGHIGSLLNLGGSFHSELTGRENCYMSGTVAGLTKRQVKERLEAIVDFAGLAPYLDNPVRSYSSGMLMRLAFSVVVHTDPDVLMVDECLSVGDLEFGQKCLERIDEMRSEGCTVILVSHGLGYVSANCDQALWINGGRVAAMGESQDVVVQYASFQTQSTQALPDSLTMPTL